MPRPLSSSFFLLLLLFLDVVGSQRLASRLDLYGLYSLRGSLGIKARDWPRKVDPCSNWVGVTCLAGRVVGLQLSTLKRTRVGKMNPRFAVDGLRNLTSLVNFNASGFLLLGSIPEWFGSSLPVGFRVLDLDRCNVSGTIPHSLGLLENLTELVLSRNRLNGSIPSALGNLTMLQRLDLSGNLLGGSIPTALGRLTKLESLELGGNSLSGFVPEEVEGLSSLQALALSHNSLDGSLPKSIWALPVLQFLDVSNNNLTGRLPEEAAGFNAKGGVLDLSNNFYYGNISSNVEGMLQRLSSGNISNNYFEGEMPFVENRSVNVSVQLNCFLGVPDQRSVADCAKFYSDRGMVYVAPTPPPTSEEVSKHKRNWHLVYILVGVLGGLLVVVFIVFLLLVCLRKRETEPAASAQRMNDVPSTQGPPLPLGSEANLSAIGDSFTYDQLLQATKNFSDVNLIKHGHSGDLYLGTLESGSAVVVKRIDADRISKELYRVELEFFNRISHTRLVPLLGHCLEKQDEKLIVYKYMPNRDLSNALYRKPEREEEGLQSLDWITRLKIATGVAEALCYLHNECSPPVVHRDIQASSILLDDKFEVRLGSLSKVCTQEGEGSQNVITRLFRISQSAGASTSGSTPATCAYDVYCLGKVLLELVTGKLGISGSDDATTNEFIEQAMPCISMQEKESLTKILDPSLIVDEDLMEEVWAMAIVAKSCLNPKVSKRPQAKIILKALENPLRVVRDENAPGSARLRATSSRVSWNAALFGSWRGSDKEMVSGPPMEITGLKSSETAGSQGGSVGEQSFNRRKPSKEIFPEPSPSSPEIES